MSKSNANKFVIESPKLSRQKLRARRIFTVAAVITKDRPVFFETEVVKLFLLSCSLTLLLLLSCQKGGLAAEVKDGKMFYVQYCSACHGQEGHGNGPAS